MTSAVAGVTSGRVVIAIALIVLLAASAAWLVQEWVERYRLRRALASADPEVRIDAIRRAAQRDLAASAADLLRLARSERDDEVIAALLEAVARRQWEPASTAKLVALRLWVRSYVNAHEELRGDQPSTTDARERGGAARGRRRSDTSLVELDVVSPQRGPGVPRSARRGAAARVVVTGGGGPAGVAVIRHLMSAGHHVIAVDAEPSAVGLRLASESHLVPVASDPGFLPRLLDIASTAEATALMCTVAEEYGALCGAEDQLAARGVASCFPSRDAVETCQDKWRFVQVMQEHGFEVPATVLGPAHDVRGPWVVKPRFGRGSVGIRFVDERAELTHAATGPDTLVQTRVTAREFTVDALVDRDGALVGCVPRWRLETKAGISTKGETFSSLELTELVAKVLSVIGLVGPANLQGFDADDGRLVLIEVNPRFSGGLPLSLYAGADLVGEYLRAILGERIRRERLAARPGVRMMRYLSEVYEG